MKTLSLYSSFQGVWHYILIDYDQQIDRRHFIPITLKHSSFSSGSCFVLLLYFRITILILSQDLGLILSLHSYMFPLQTYCSIVNINFIFSPRQEFNPGSFTRIRIKFTYIDIIKISQRWHHNSIKDINFTPDWRFYNPMKKFLKKTPLFSRGLMFLRHSLMNPTMTIPSTISPNWMLPSHKGSYIPSRNLRFNLIAIYFSRHYQ